MIADREAVLIDPTSVSTDLDRAQTALDADVPVATDMVAALTTLRKPLLAGLYLSRHEPFAIWLAAERAAAERLR